MNRVDDITSSPQIYFEEQEYGQVISRRWQLFCKI